MSEGLIALHIEVIPYLVYHTLVVIVIVGIAIDLALDLDVTVIGFSTTQPVSSD